MLVVKTLHIVFMVTWFAGLFYLPRLFVYHCLATDAIGIERFKVMERKLYWGIMTPCAVLAIVFGLWLWLGYGISGGWLYAKLALVAMLVAHHIWLGKLMARLRGRPQRAQRQVLSLDQRGPRAADPRRRRLPRRREAVLTPAIPASRCGSSADDRALLRTVPARARGGARRRTRAAGRHPASRPPTAASRSRAISALPIASTSSRASRAASCGASRGGPYRDEADLYALVHAVDWKRLFLPVADAARRRRGDALAAARASNSRRCASRMRCATAFAPTSTSVLRSTSARRTCACTPT